MADDGCVVDAAAIVQSRRTSSQLANGPTNSSSEAIAARGKPHTNSEKTPTKIKRERTQRTVSKTHAGAVIMLVEVEIPLNKMLLRLQHPCQPVTQLPKLLFLLGTEMACTLAKRVHPGDQPGPIVGCELHVVMSLPQ